MLKFDNNVKGMFWYVSDKKCINIIMIIIV